MHGDRCHARNKLLRRRWNEDNCGLGTHLAATLPLDGDGIVGGRPMLKNSPGKALPAPAPHV